MKIINTDNKLFLKLSEYKTIIEKNKNKIYRNENGWFIRKNKTIYNKKLYKTMCNILNKYDKKYQYWNCI